MDTPAIDLDTLLDKQRAAWRASVPDLAQRRDDLARLRSAFKNRLEDFVRAVSDDFGHRPREETLVADGMPVLREIDHLRRHLRRWMKPRAVAADGVFLPARCQIVPKPLGVVGIISPWNYPINLALIPLVDALAAGNHVMLKPSEHTPRTSTLLAELLAGVFPRERVAVVEGDARMAAAFAALPFDHLLFTGSGVTGAKVLAAAAPNLTPVTLELGGKSPAILAPGSVNARNVGRLAAGKFLNAGQTCIAPDYALVQAAEREALVARLRDYVGRAYAWPSHDGDYASIINEAQYARLLAALEEAREAGAQVTALCAPPADAAARRVVVPHVVLDAPESALLMREEIFGPILPVVTYDVFDEAIEQVNARPRPLALYLFDDDATRVRRTLAACTAGGVAVNDCLLQFAQSRLPFGGVGASGMGVYHGYSGFIAFSKQMPVFHQARWSASDWLRPPYGPGVTRLLRLLLR